IIYHSHNTNCKLFFIFIIPNGHLIFDRSFRLYLASCLVKGSQPRAARDNLSQVKAQSQV
ncbi:MAG: hypothetical protein WD469_10080, partial [Paenibacillaceae bacterium]